MDLALDLALELVREVQVVPVWLDTQVITTIIWQQQPDFIPAISPVIVRQPQDMVREVAPKCG